MSDRDELRVTMVRCSTLLLQWRGRARLTDPWFGMRVWAMPCLQRPGLCPGDLPRLDAALVSHLHPDHFDRRALGELAPPQVLVPAGSAAAMGGSLEPGWRELSPGDEAEVAGIPVHAVRGPHTRPGPEEINFVLQLPNLGPVFFGGDARLDQDVLREVHDRFGSFRLAMLPVGGSRILGRRTVMSPRDAVVAADLLQAREVIPIHEGGIWLSAPPLSYHPGRARRFAELMRGKWQAGRAAVLQPGEFVTIRP